MACRGCESQAEKDAAMRKSIEIAQQTKEVAVRPNRMMIACGGCGLMRLLPSGLKVDDEFTLVPCPKCFQALRGKFVGEGVQEIL